MTVKYGPITSVNEKSNMPTEWVSVNAFTTMQKVVARASSRVFVGIPVCGCWCSLLAVLSDMRILAGRNEDYLRLAIVYTVAVAADRDMMKYYPSFFKK